VQVRRLNFWQNSPVTPISEVKNAIEAAAPPDGAAAAPGAAAPTTAKLKPREVGGREGPEPTRYGDWELKGRCIDF
jgi:hypothetical protein